MDFLYTKGFGLFLQLVMLVVALSALWLTRQHGRRQAPRKELSFGVINRQLLFGVSDLIREDVQMAYKGQPVRRLTCLSFAIMNTGQQPILKDDFQGKAKISFSDGDLIVSAEVQERRPSHANPIVSYCDSTVTFEPLLFNPGDYLVIRAIVDTNEIDSPKFTTTITGITQLPRLSRGRHPGYEIGFLTFLLFILLVISALAWGVWKTQGLTWGGGLLIAVFVALPAFALIMTVRDLRRTLRARWMGKGTDSIGHIKGL